MLKHYDTLNWQIGSILIGANAVLLGLVVGFLGRVGWFGILVAFGVSLFSFILLEAWWRWFWRHKQFYDFRNETLQRIELKLGMFHFLRLAYENRRQPEPGSARWRRLLRRLRLAPQSMDQPTATMTLEMIEALRDQVYELPLPGRPRFEPMYLPTLSNTTSGWLVACSLRVILPVCEFTALFFVVLAERL